VFLEPIKRKLNDNDQKTKILDKQEMKLIFGNVEKIVQVSQALYESLNGEWKEALAQSRPPIIGRIFLEQVAPRNLTGRECKDQMHISPSSIPIHTSFRLCGNIRESACSNIWPWKALIRPLD